MDEELRQQQADEAWEAAETPGVEPETGAADGQEMPGGEMPGEETGEAETQETETGAEPTGVQPERGPEGLRGEMREFLEAYPGVKGADVPREVWEAAIRGQNLTLAYSIYKNRSLERELAEARRHSENVQRTTGSQAANAPSRPEELISVWWNEAE